MRKFFIAVFTIAVAVMAAYGIKYVVMPVNTQKLEYITQENAINTNGFIIRDEWVMYTRSAGTVYHSVSEGERVARDSAVGMLFYGDVSADGIKELAVVDNKIKSAGLDSAAQSVTEMDATTVENNVYSREHSIIEAARNNDIRAISKYKNDINSLRQNNTLSAHNSVEELENQKVQILSNIGVPNEFIYAKISGVFTTYVDGYETSLVPADIENYDVSYFESLSQSPEMTKISEKADAGGAVCKIANNHLWYVMVSIPAETMNGRERGDDIRLRFNNMADAEVAGTINSVSGEQNGRVVVTVKCPTYLESAFSYRLVDVDLIFEKYDGYKIPVHAIRTEEDGRQKVIGLSGNKQYDCYCDILFTNTDGGYAIVDSTEDAQNKLSAMDRIMVGER